MKKQAILITIIKQIQKTAQKILYFAFHSRTKHIQNLKSVVLWRTNLCKISICSFISNNETSTAPYTSQLYTFPEISTLEKSKLSTTNPFFEAFFDRKFGFSHNTYTNELFFFLFLQLKSNQYLKIHA